MSKKLAAVTEELIPLLRQSNSDYEKRMNFIRFLGKAKGTQYIIPLNYKTFVLQFIAFKLQSVVYTSLQFKLVEKTATHYRVEIATTPLFNIIIDQAHKINVLEPYLLTLLNKHFYPIEAVENQTDVVLYNEKDKMKEKTIVIYNLKNTAGLMVKISEYFGDSVVFYNTGNYFLITYRDR